MKKSYTISNDEPVGIVISHGPRTEPTPLFSAYAWISTPEAAPSVSTDTSKAA